MRACARACVLRLRRRTVRFLEKKKGKLSGWKARYFVVAGHHAAYYAQEAVRASLPRCRCCRCKAACQRAQDVGKTLPFGVFHLENSPVELDKDDKTFSLCVDDVVWSMRAQTAEDRHRWADVFRQSDLRLAAAAGKLPLGHPFYCPQLGSYVDHDVFTLADADGALTVAGPNLPPQKVWAAFSRPHLGLFQSEEHVGRYTSLRRLYIEPDRVNRVEKRCVCWFSLCAAQA